MSYTEGVVSRRSHHRSRRPAGATLGSAAKNRLFAVAEQHQAPKNTTSTNDETEEQRQQRLFENDSAMLRGCIATLFRAGSTLKTYRYAAQKVEPNLATEQLWSQLNVLYAPTMSRFAEKEKSFMMDASKLASASSRDSNTDPLAAIVANEKNAAAAAKISGKDRKAMLRSANSKSGGGNNAAGDDDDVLGAGKKLGRLPKFVQRLDDEDEEWRATRGKGSKDPNRFFAFGRGGDDDADDADMDDFIGDGGGLRGAEDGGAARARRGGMGGFDDDNDDEDFDDDDFDDEADNDGKRPISIRELNQKQQREAMKNAGTGGASRGVPMDEGDQLGDFRGDALGGDEGEDEEDLDNLDLDFGGEDDEELDEEDADAAYREMYGDGAEDDEEGEGDDDDDLLNEFGDDDDDLLQGSKSKAKKGKRFEAAGFDDNDDDDQQQPRKKTPFELAEEQRAQRIRQAELDRLAGSWEMKGEVAASERPRDALLDTDLQMEHALPTAPVITESLTARLEDRLKKRILANQFDDVVRRNPRLVNLAEDARAQKILMRDKLDQEGQKSKASLVDLYEKDFLDRQQRAAQSGAGQDAAEPLTALEQDELKALQQWRRIAQHLDALSNFHFTPKPVAADLDARVRAVQDQAPAISVESKGMFALSREKVLAPQDIFRVKPGAGGGAAQASGASKDEMTPAEKRSVRAAHKRSHQVSQALTDRRKHQAETRKRSAPAPTRED